MRNVVSVEQVHWRADIGRWYVDGEPVHAGASLEIQGHTQPPDDLSGDAYEAFVCEPYWFLVRIESEDSGRRLFAYHTVHGIPFRILAASAGGTAFNPLPFSLHPLRWPIAKGGGG